MNLSSATKFLKSDFFDQMKENHHDPQDLTHDPQDLTHDPPDHIKRPSDNLDDPPDPNKCLSDIPQKQTIDHPSYSTPPDHLQDIQPQFSNADSPNHNQDFEPLEFYAFMANDPSPPKEKPTPSFTRRALNYMSPPARADAPEEIEETEEENYPVETDPLVEAQEEALRQAKIQAEKLQQARVSAVYDDMFLMKMQTIADNIKPKEVTEPKDKPIMGGIKFLGSHYEPWTGGKPNNRWTGLASNATDTDNPNFLRGSGPKSTISYNARREGLYKENPSSRFSEKDDLDDFCKQLKQAFNNNGLDTIAHRNDPSNYSSMINVLEEYPRLYSKTIRTCTEAIYKKWDKFDKDNDESARKFLYASLKDNLRKRLEGKIKDDDTFADIFMVFIEMMRPYSTDLFNSIEKKVEGIHPRDFDGQNITKMVEKLRPLIQRLVKGRAWNSSKNVNLCRTLSEACSDVNNPEYSNPMANLLQKVKEEALKITYMNNEDKAKHMNKWYPHRQGRCKGKP